MIELLAVAMTMIATASVGYIRRMLIRNPAVKLWLLAEPEIFGWNAFNDWAVVVRLRVKATATLQPGRRTRRGTTLTSPSRAGSV